VDTHKKPWIANPYPCGRSITREASVRVDINVYVERQPLE